MHCEEFRKLGNDYHNKGSFYLFMADESKGGDPHSKLQGCSDILSLGVLEQRESETSWLGLNVLTMLTAAAAYTRSAARMVNSLWRITDHRESERGRRAHFLNMERQNVLQGLAGYSGAAAPCLSRDLCILNAELEEARRRKVSASFGINASWTHWQHHDYREGNELMLSTSDDKCWMVHFAICEHDAYHDPVMVALVRHAPRHFLCIGGSYGHGGTFIYFDDEAGTLSHRPAVPYEKGHRPKKLGLPLNANGAIHGLIVIDGAAMETALGRAAATTPTEFKRLFLDNLALSERPGSQHFIKPTDKECSFDVLKAIARAGAVGARSYDAAMSVTEEIRDPIFGRACDITWDMVQSTLQTKSEATKRREPLGEPLAKQARIAKPRKEQTEKSRNERAKKPSPYIVFTKAKREEIKGRNPSADFFEIGRLLGAAWRALPQTEKDAYKQTAAPESTAEDAAVSEHDGTDPHLNVAMALDFDDAVADDAEAGTDSDDSEPESGAEEEEEDPTNAKCIVKSAGCRCLSRLAIPGSLWKACAGCEAMGENGALHHAKCYGLEDLDPAQLVQFDFLCDSCLAQRADSAARRNLFGSSEA